jgi:nitrogen fixation protein FixH
MCCCGLCVMPFEGRSLVRQASPPRQPSAPRPLTGRGVLLALGLFFGAMLAANAALTYSALRTLPGGEIANSYDASQIYNLKIADARAQDERGWRARVTVLAENGGARVAFGVSGQDGAPIDGLQVIARFEHPADRRMDREVPLSPHDGSYEGFAPALHAGGWTLVIEAGQDGARAYVSRSRITLADQAKRTE